MISTLQYGIELMPWGMYKPINRQLEKIEAYERRITEATFKSKGAVKEAALLDLNWTPFSYRAKQRRLLFHAKIK